MGAGKPCARIARIGVHRQVNACHTTTAPLPCALSLSLPLPLPLSVSVSLSLCLCLSLYLSAPPPLLSLYLIYRALESLQDKVSGYKLYCLRQGTSRKEKKSSFLKFSSDTKEPKQLQFWGFGEPMTPCMGLAATIWVPVGAQVPVLPPNDHPNPSQGQQKGFGKS